jgi:hypothetical protein
MSSLRRLSSKTSHRRRNLWFERVVAILALTNYGIVLFDLSYIPWRDFYLRAFPAFRSDIGGLDVRVPSLTDIYDPIKGIEPNRDTQRYIDAVNALKAQVAQTGLQSPEVEPLLARLRNLSAEMIDTNPFEVANKTGALEKIKNRMRSRVPNQGDSSKQAFREFWSQEYLSGQGFAQAIAFYNQEIQPPIETNYFRPFGETGDLVDYFWKIDIWFASLFFIEFLLRTYYIHRRHAGLRWLDAMLWRWYDIFLFLPLWRWLRIVPIVIRLNQADLLDLLPIQKQINQGFVANFAEDLTEVIVVRIISQIQNSIRQEDFSRWLAGAEAQTYIDLNDTNEVEALVKLGMEMAVYQVFPKIRPDIEALLQHNIDKVLNQTPAVQGLQKVPGMEQWQHQFTEKLVKEICQAVYDTVNGALQPDPVGGQLLERLIQNASVAFGAELQAKHTLERVKYLLIAFLEEVKINYVERLSEEDLEAVLEQTRAIHRIAQR